MIFLKLFFQIKNYPLYMKSVTNDLKYWFTVHTSLDVIEEKTQKFDFKDMYLGLLYLTEEFRVYAFVCHLIFFYY
jgi:hypothetical protein